MIKRKLVLLLSVSIMILSCGVRKPVVITKKVTKKVTETVHDTIFSIEKDSSYYHALLACKEDKVYLMPNTQTYSSGRTLETPKVTITDNKLEVDCQAKAQELFAKWKSKHTSDIIETQVPVYVPRELTWWQKTQIWWGRIFAILILLSLVPKLIKHFIK